MKGWKHLFLELIRSLVGSVFVLSGLLKAIDPVGLSLKIQEYLLALQPVVDLSWLSGVSIHLGWMLCITEFALGAFLLVGIYRRLCTKLILVLMLAMTALSIYIFLVNPVADCGCFGDALKLSHAQTLGKNLILLPMSWLLARSARKLRHLYTRHERWFIASITFISISVFLWGNQHHLPIIDLSPYKVGADLRSAIALEDSIAQAQILHTRSYIYERDGKQELFSLSELPDSTWLYVGRKERDLDQGQPHPYAFHLYNENGEDLAPHILEHPRGVFLWIYTHFDGTTGVNPNSMVELYLYSKEQGYDFYVVSSMDTQEQKRWQYLMGINPPMLFADKTLVQTLAKVNPTLIVLKNGVIMDKVPYSLLPKTNFVVNFAEDTLHNRKTTHEQVWRILPLLLLGLTLLLGIVRMGVRWSYIRYHLRSKK